MTQPNKMMEEIVHYCTKCKRDLNHRITRVEKGKPKRLLCLTCQTERQYRANSGPKADKPARAKRATTAKPSARAVQEAEWRDKLNQRNQVPKPYQMDGAPYALEDAIEHPTFGRGVVVTLIPPDKVQVYFEDGLKLLKCGKKVPPLPIPVKMKS